MNLEKKKDLASRALEIGKKRIVFNISRLAEIKEAITKQDMRDLFNSGAIQIREVTGRLKVERRKIRRKAGSVRKKIVNKKRQYMIITRKLRSLVADLRKKESITRETYLQLRKEIKAKAFRDKSHLKERVQALK